MALFDKSWYVNFGNGSSTGYYAVSIWTALATIAPGTFVRQAATPTVGNERCFVCIDATGTGVTGATEPTWIITRGGKTTDGTVTWQECTGIPACNGDIGASYQNEWVASTAFTLGSVIYDPTSASVQILSTAGTSKSGSAPTFSATAGVATTDNTCTWTSLGLASGFSAFEYPHARLANAFVSTWGQAGNNFAVASNHAETQSGSFTLTSPGTASACCNVYCISNTTTLSSPTLATSATISGTGSSIIATAGYWYMNGVSLIAGTSSGLGDIQLCYASGSSQFFENYTFNLNNTNTSSFFGWNIGNNEPTYFSFVNCTHIFGSTSQSIMMGNGRALIVNGTIAQSGSVPSSLIKMNTTGGIITIKDTDLSAITGSIVNTNGLASDIYLQNCKLASGVSIVTGGLSGLGYATIHMANCDNGTTNYRYYYQNANGTVIQETTIIRSGGASNGTTGISWNITTSANASFTQPFVSEDIEIWNSATGSPITVTFYITSNTALSNNQFWAEVEYLGTSGNPLGAFINGRMTPLANPTGLTSDTSTWGGSTTYKYKCTLTLIPGMAGPVKARFYTAVASATIYVDPEIYGVVNSSRQYFVPGWGMVNESATSSGGGTPILQSGIIQGLGAI